MASPSEEPRGDKRHSVTNHPRGGRFLCTLVVQGMATAGAEPWGWNRPTAHPIQPQWGHLWGSCTTCPADGFGQPSVRCNIQAGALWPSSSQQLPNGVSICTHPIFPTHRARHSPWDRSWSILLPRHAFRTGAAGRGADACIHPAARGAPSSMEGPAGAQPLLPPGHERAAPSRGMAPCLQPKACGRPACLGCGWNECKHIPLPRHGCLLFSSAAVID